MSPITTHVLDTSRGRPAQGVSVWLESGDTCIGEGVTNADGRVTDLLPEGALEPGVYQIRFDTGGYFRAQGVKGFYPEVRIAFVVEAGEAHYHVPLLLNPYGYSTYRGS